MSQPPDEPTPESAQGPPDPGWQPPGPVPQQPPQQPGTPYGQNPYGGGTTNYYRPIDSGRMSSSVKVVLGVVIGVFGGFFLWFFAAIAFSATSTTGTGNEFLFFAAVAPLLVPLPLLAWKASRPWALGLLMGTAVASIGMSSLCSAMISSFEGGA